MKTLMSIITISLFSFIPSTNTEEIQLEEIDINIENIEYQNELDNADFSTLILNEIPLNIENSRYQNELEEANFYVSSLEITLEEINLPLQYNEEEDLYELEDVILEEIPLT